MNTYNKIPYSSPSPPHVHVNTLHRGREAARHPSPPRTHEQPNEEEDPGRPASGKERRSQDHLEGCLLAAEVVHAVPESDAFPADVILDEKNALLRKANIACELLQDRPQDEGDTYRRVLKAKAILHPHLGQHTLAASTFQQVHEIYSALERKGMLNSIDQSRWRDNVALTGDLLLSSGRLEAAKRCFLQILTWPRMQTPFHRMNALHSMARYHRARRDWAKVVECSLEALSLVPEGKKHCDIGCSEERVLILLADAAEGQGDLPRAHEYDKKVLVILFRQNATYPFLELAACKRREAMQLLAAGRPHDAIPTLNDELIAYVQMIKYWGINLLGVVMLVPVMAAVKVLADALVRTGREADLILGGRIRADVEETESIITAYWEGVLEEKRLELQEQRRAAAAAGAAAVVEAREEASPAMNKSKAAKRKQQKRKAQQQKKAAEKARTAEAPAAAEPARGEEVTERQEKDEEETQEEEVQEGEAQEEDMEIGEEIEEKTDCYQAMTTAVIALSTIVLSATAEQEEADGEEEECSVCLNLIESEDVDNPAGPLLVCGHRYHAFCLPFWVETCRSKCIEPTCPYCRAPLPEMDSG